MVIWRERLQYVRLGETTICQVGRTGIRKAIPANTRHWTNPGSVLGRRRRWWANIDPTLTGIQKAIPTNTRNWTNAGSILGRRRRWWANIEPTLVQCLVFSGNFLPCKAKRQYVITSQVSRYCLLALRSSDVGGWMDEMPVNGLYPAYRVQVTHKYTNKRPSTHIVVESVR